MAWYDCLFFSLGQEQKAQMISGGDLTTGVKKIYDIMSPTVAVLFLFKKKFPN